MAIDAVDESMRSLSTGIVSGSLDVGGLRGPALLSPAPNEECNAGRNETAEHARAEDDRTGRRFAPMNRLHGEGRFRCL